MVQKAQEYDFTDKEIESARNENGAIDADKLGLRFTLESKETRGTEFRVKNWTKINGKDYLWKSEVDAPSDGFRNYGHYGELFLEEAYEEAGLPTAEYDLAEMSDAFGHRLMGNVTKSVINDPARQQLFTLHDILGDDAGGVGSSDLVFDDTFDMRGAQDSIKDALCVAGFEEEEIDNLIYQLKCEQALGIACICTDKHLENIHILVTDKSHLSIVGIDGEASFMMDTTRDSIEKMNAMCFMHQTKEVDGLINSAYPRVVDSTHESEYSESEPWKGTFRELMEDPKVREFYNKNVRNLDIHDIINRTEQKIHAPVEGDAAYFAEYAFNSRRREIEKEFGYFLDNGRDRPKEEKRMSLDEMLKILEQDSKKQRTVKSKGNKREREGESL